MKKYVVPSEDNKSWKLIASHSIPSHAVAEAPEHWTREMEPYIIVGSTKSGGQTIASLSLDPAWTTKQKVKKSEKLSADLTRMRKVSESIKKAELDRKFNALNPAQRYIKSILGDWTTTVGGSIGRTIMLAIFKDKLY